jgi:hypothetical protein
MLRFVLGLCLIGSGSCSGGPYFIGEHRADAGLPGECETVQQDALWCSGFEAEDLLSEWDDIEVVMAGEVARTTERAYSGQGGLRAASNGGESVAVVIAELEPVSSGTLYLRTHMFVPAGLPTETINIMFVGSDPAPDPFVGIDINLEGGALQVFSPQADPARQTGELLIPRDRWFCLQTEIAVSAQGSVQLLVDDTLALEATNIDTLPEGGIQLFRAGVDWSSAQQASFEIYLDDVVLDRAPVACATATTEAER